MDLLVKRMNTDVKLPTKAYSGDAGWDLYASDDFTVPAGSNSLVGTGCKFAIPEGYYGRIADRSSMALKGLHVLAGVVDAGFRNEVKVILHNFNSVDYQIKKGEKVAQMIIEKIHTGSLVEVDDLDQTERNMGGFGSSGK